METAAESDGTHEPKSEQDDGSQVARPPKRAQCVSSARAHLLNAKEHSRKGSPGQQRDKRSCRSQMRSAADAGTPRRIATLTHVHILQMLMKLSRHTSKVTLSWRHTSELPYRISLELPVQHSRYPHGYRFSRDGSGRTRLVPQVPAANAGLESVWVTPACAFISGWSVTNQAGQNTETGY